MIRQGAGDLGLPGRGGRRASSGSRATGSQKVPSTLANPAGSFSQAVFAWGEGRSVGLLDEPRVFAALRRLGPMSDDLSGFSLMDLFRSEAEGQTAILSEGLLALEGGDAPSPAALEPLMRAAHSLKGAARIVGLDAAVRVAHALEDNFVAAQHGEFAIRPAARRRPAPGGRPARARSPSSPRTEAAAWQAENEAVDRGDGRRAWRRSGRGERRPAPTAPPPAPTRPPRAGRPTGHRGRRSPSRRRDPPPAAEARRPRPASRPAPAGRAGPGRRRPPEAPERVVRVTAESLSRLMGLAGESLVQARQLRPFVDALLALRSRQAALIETLQALEDRRTSGRGRLGGGRASCWPGPGPRRAGASRTWARKVEAFEDYARRGEDLAGRLHHEVLASRMRPLADGVRGFPRMVRDVARRAGQAGPVRGPAARTTGVDRDILDKLEAPLNHLIRNALDHAIEPPEERDGRRQGRRPATIRLEARHRAGMLQITLTDDGRGIDPARLRAKVVERGLATAEMADRLTEAELLEFLFLPGFSTKEAVTEISGRGVGLDVVQDMVRSVGGRGPGQLAGRAGGPGSRSSCRSRCRSSGPCSSGSPASPTPSR